MARLDREADRLYGLPLDEFTAARNAAAGDLAKAGDRETSEAVKALPKPSLVAWAVNQVARRRPELVRAVLTAGRELRKAHRAALSGKGAEGVAEATRSERRAVAEVITAARAVLADAGRRPTEQTLDKVAATVHAATFDLQAGKLLEAGRLTEELEPSGFGPLLTEAPPPAAARGARARPRPAERRRERVRAAEQELREARKEQFALRAEADEAEREADRARRAAEKAAERADTAAARVEKLERELEQLRG